MQQHYTRIRSKIFTPSSASMLHLAYIVLMLVYISFPLVADATSLPVQGFDFFTVVVICCSLLLPEKPRIMLWVVGTLGIGLTILLMGDSINVANPVYHYRVISKVVFFVMLLRIFIKEIIFSEISLSMIYQSISTYLLLGIIFSLIFRLIHLHESHAFNFLIIEEFNHMYLSFLTLTSVGLGDLLPMNMAAKSAIMVESIVGQIYLAFFVSMMIGKYMRRETVK